MTDVATCPDCLRPKADDARPTTLGCKQGLFTALGEPYRSRCFELAVDRLRSDLANLQTRCDTRAAAHAKPSPELTAVEDVVLDLQIGEVGAEAVDSKLETSAPI